MARARAEAAFLRGHCACAVNMQRLTFFDSKRTILSFDVENLEFSRQEEGILLNASGRITSQDSAALEELSIQQHSCKVSLDKDGENVLNQQFFPSFLVLEENTLVVLLMPA